MVVKKDLNVMSYFKNFNKVNLKNVNIISIVIISNKIKFHSNKDNQINNKNNNISTMETY